MGIHPPNEVIFLRLGCYRTELKSGAIAHVADTSKSEPFVLYYPLETKNRLIKFLYRDNDGIYHVFNSSPYTNDWINGAVGIEDMKQLEELVGDRSKIILYYLVMEEIFLEFKPDDIAYGVSCLTYCIRIRRPTDSKYQFKLD